MRKNDQFIHSQILSIEHSCVWRLEPWWTVYCRLKYFASNAVIGVEKLIADNKISTAEADFSSAKGNHRSSDASAAFITISVSVVVRACAQCTFAKACMSEIACLCACGYRY